VSFAAYITGLVVFAVTWGSLLVAAEILVRRRLGHLRGANRLVAFGVIFSAGLVGVHVLAGALTILNRWVVAGFAIAGLILVWRLLAPVEAREPAPRSIPPSSPLTRLLAWLAVGGFAACALYTLRLTYSTPVLHVDALGFHLPGVIRWIQSGSIWHNNEFLARFPTGAYPNNGDIVFLSAVLPWRSDAFVRLVDLPWLALLGIAVYAIALELRTSRATAALFAAMVLSIRAISSFALVQLDPDIFLLATFACGALFLVRHPRHERRPEMVLAGTALGLAFGTKWYGLADVAALLAVWGGVAWIKRPGAVAVIRKLLGLTGLTLLFGGVWLIRNWVTTGDPFYPGRVLVFKPPVDLYLKLFGYSLFDRLGQPQSWTHYVLPDLRVAIGGPGIVLLVGIVIVVLVLVLRLRTAVRASRSWRRLPDSEAVTLAATALAAAVIYFFTPATAQGRKSAPFPGLVGGNSRTLIPALVLAAPVVAWAGCRLGRWRHLLALAATLATFDGLEQTFDLPLGGLTKFTVVVAAVLAVIALAIRQSRHWSWSVRRGLAIGAAGLVAVAVIALGQHGQRHFYRYRYRGLDPALDWVLANAPQGHRIGVAGNWRGGTPDSPILPLFGPRFGNTVAFVGQMDVGTLVQYTREQRFIAAVRRGGYDVLFVGREPPPLGSRRLIAPAWARAAGFREVAASARFMAFIGPNFREDTSKR
jgi:hypothetical protein